MPGLEPGAFWFVAKRSIQLGYIRVLLSSLVDASKYRIIKNIVKGKCQKNEKNFFDAILAPFQNVLIEQLCPFIYFCPQTFLVCD